MASGLKSVPFDQAFIAMYLFLEKQQSLSPSEDLAILLGSMALLDDGIPADPAVLQDWTKSVEEALNGAENASLKIK